MRGINWTSAAIRALLIHHGHTAVSSPTSAHTPRTTLLQGLLQLQC